MFYEKRLLKNHINSYKPIIFRIIMRKEKSFLLRELNPRYDMSRFDEGLSPSRDHAMYALGVFKSAIRGSIVGAGLGGLVGLATGLANGGDLGKEVTNAVAVGLPLGFILDVSQFMTRYCLSFVQRNSANQRRNYMNTKKAE